MIDKATLLLLSAASIWIGLVYSIAQYEIKARAFKESAKLKTYDELKKPTNSLMDNSELLAQSFIVIGSVGLAISIPMILELSSAALPASIILMAAFFFGFAKILTRVKLKTYLRVNQLNTAEEIKGAMSTWLRPKGISPIDKLDDDSTFKKTIVKSKPFNKK